MAGSKNLIMGLWVNLPFAPLEHFLASLRRTSFDGDVCICVDNVTAATVRSLQAYDVIVERAGRFAVPHFKLNPRPEPQYPIVRQARGDDARPGAMFDAIVCFYYRPRDVECMQPFQATLRAAGFEGDIHCVGELDAAEHAMIARFGAVAHQIGSTDTLIDTENLAHLCVSRILDEIAAGETLPDEVLALDTMRAGFLRHPFLGKTIGLSLFYEGSERLGRSDYNLHRLSLFTDIDDTWRERPVISSAAFRGGLQTVRRFYNRLLTEFVGKEQLLRVPKVIQGAVNKLAHDTTIGFPVVIHPNAAEIYFEIGDQTLNIEDQQQLRVGGTVPAIVVNPFKRTFMEKVIASQRL